MRMIYVAFFLRILGGMACEGLASSGCSGLGMRRYTIPPDRYLHVALFSLHVQMHQSGQKTFVVEVDIKLFVTRSCKANYSYISSVPSASLPFSFPTCLSPTTSILSY
jgi:hypothetical protein